MEIMDLGFTIFTECSPRANVYNIMQNEAIFCGKCNIFLLIVQVEGSIFCVCPANERWRYIATSSLIGWAHTQNDPCNCVLI